MLKKLLSIRIDCAIRNNLIILAGLALLLLLQACSPSTLPTGLSQRMDVQNAQLDKTEALILINQYRASRGAAPLTLSPVLTNTAERMSEAYARSGTRPSLPEEADKLLLSAGYTTFADTFSGWRGQPNDAGAMAASDMTQIGLAASYSSASEFGVHWVMLLAK